MYAVIESGGKQYKVCSGEVVKLERFPVEKGAAIRLNRVFLIQGQDGLIIGNPTIPGACVTGEVVTQGRSRKIIVFKKKRRKNYRRTQGHRQAYTEIRITGIETQPAEA